MYQDLWEQSRRLFIGIKSIGELDSKPFLAASKRINKNSGEGKVTDRTALELHSLWVKHLEDSNWKPFKIITDEEGSKVCISLI